SHPLNIKDIESVTARPDLKLKPNVTRTTAAGFMPHRGLPSGERPTVEVEDKDGNKYKATFDGYQDFGPKGWKPQLTPQEDIPGGFMKGSTTYGPSLEAKGIKLPTLPSRAPEGQYMPAKTYHEASAGKGNPYVKTDDIEDNSGRTLMVQFASDLLYKGARQEGVPAAYYDKLYSGARKGYASMADLSEIPQWHGFLSYFDPSADLYVVRDMKEAHDFLNNAGYKELAFSALDVNKDLIKEIAEQHPDINVNASGYVDPKEFEGMPNVTWHPNMESFAKQFGLPYKEGVDYRHYAGSDVIPRLTMSTGCKHKCAFCSIEKTVVPTPDDVVNQQADAIAKLGSKLVYLNDKTFGQSE